MTWDRPGIPYSLPPTSSMPHYRATNPLLALPKGFIIQTKENGIQTSTAPPNVVVLLSPPNMGESSPSNHSKLNPHLPPLLLFFLPRPCSIPCGGGGAPGRRTHFPMVGEMCVSVVCVGEMTSPDYCTSTLYLVFVCGTEGKHENALFSAVDISDAPLTQRTISRCT